ncbi:hypothetical protein ACFY9F_19160 [Streptomyces sp. NPDC012421]|uniref:DUF7507 domain-containing protein n=1 Tax=Streptomyces sp. NPDC012421 TaxID=3364832 RepID=UPI0036ECCEE1
MRRAVRAGAGILVGVLALPCLALAGGGGAWAGGAGDEALRVSVTVNGRGYGADGPTPVRAGRDVVKRYRLVNGGGADLYGVRVRDPGIPSGTGVRCPRRTLVGLTSMECVARFRALPGARTATVRAEGRIPSLGLTAAATARSGYTGVTGSLVLGERVRPGAAGATLTYTVTNQGNRALRDVRVTDPALGLSGAAVDCGGRPGLVPVLAPGTSARCTATVRRPSGTHRSTGLAAGTDRIRTYVPDGRLVPAPLLTARAAGSFTVPEREAGRAPEPPREPGREVGAEAGAGAGAGGGGGGGALPGVPRPLPGAAGAPAAPGAGAGAGGAPGAPAVPVPALPGAPGVPAGAGAAASVAAAAVPPAAGPLPVGPPAPDAPPALAAVGAGAPAPAPAGAEAADAGPGAVEAMEGAGAGTAPVAGTSPVAGVAGEGRVEAPPAAREAAGAGEARGAGEAPVGGRTPAEEARRAAALDDEGFLGRVRRRGREADEMGVVVMLLLILVPAALAAALLGNRRN